MGDIAFLVIIFMSFNLEFWFKAGFSTEFNPKDKAMPEFVFLCMV